VEPSSQLAKTDRLDTELLKRAFLGWLQGEPDHCHMAAIPTLNEEDARRPSRERENLVSQQTSLIKRMKACLVRLGIRNFKPTLRQASERLESLRTGEGAPLPANAVTELRRDMARLRLARAQIKEIEADRMRRLNQTPEDRPRAMVRLLARVIGVGIEQPTCWCTKSSRDASGIAGLLRVTLASRARPMRAATAGGRRALLPPGMHACGAT
jgi:transposase